MIELLISLAGGLYPVETKVEEPNIDYCVQLINTDYNKFKQVNCDLEKTNSYIMEVKQGRY